MKNFDFKKYLGKSRRNGSNHETAYYKIYVVERCFRFKISKKR